MTQIRSTAGHRPRTRVRCRRRAGWWQSARRLPRVAALLMLAAAVMVGAGGLPVYPITPAVGGAYPCEGKGCGCTTAAACWSGCCCTTPAQRIAWAKSRGIAVPASLIARAATQRAAKPPATKPCSGSCCQKHTARSCCGTTGSEPAATKSCCGMSVAVRRAASPVSGGVSFLAAARCRGLGTHWATGGEPLALPDPPPILPGVLLAAAVAMTFPTSRFDAPPPPARPG